MRIQEGGWWSGSRWMWESTRLTSAWILPVMYGDRSTLWNHSTTAAAAVAPPSATSGHSLAASSLQPHHVFDQSDLFFRRQTTLSAVSEVDQAPGSCYFAGAYGDVLAPSSSGEPFTAPAFHRKCLNSFCVPFLPIVLADHTVTH